MGSRILRRRVRGVGFGVLEGILEAVVGIWVLGLDLLNIFVVCCCWVFWFGFESWFC